MRITARWGAGAALFEWSVPLWAIPVVEEKKKKNSKVLLAA